MESNPTGLKKNHSFEWEFLEKTRPVYLVGFAVLLLLLQAVPHLARGYRVDDIYSIVASRSLPGLFRMFRDYENNMSLFQIILYFWMKLFGEGEAATHSLSLLAAVITLPVFFRLERIWLNRTISFFGVLLLAVSPRFVHHSVETRSYAMLILSVTISSWLYARLLLTPGYRLALLYGLSVGIGCYLHYFALLIVPVHMFTFTRRTFSRKNLLPLLLAAVVAVVVISPLVLFPPHDKTQVNGTFPPTVMDLWYVLSACFASGYVFLILLGCAVLSVVTGTWKPAAFREYQPEKLAAAWAIFPVLLMWIFSLYVTSLFITRYFVWLTPGVALLTALLVSYAGRNRIVKTGLCVLLLGVFITKTAALFRTIGDGYREPVGYINQQIKNGDAVVCYPYYWNMEVNFYLDKNGPFIPGARPLNIAGGPFLSGGGGVDPYPDFVHLEKISKSSGRVFLLSEGSPGLGKGDSIQNRIWLTAIQKRLVSQHPKVREIMYDGQTQTPMRLQIFE